MLHELLLMAENHPVHSLLWYPCRQYDCHQRNPQGSIMKQWNQSSSKSHFQWKSTYPTQALDADVISFSSTRGAIGNPVLQLIEVSGSSNPTIEFTAIFYGNCRKKKKVEFLVNNKTVEYSYVSEQDSHQKYSEDSLPLYFGSHLTLGGRPLMLKCLPSKSEHCFSRKSCLPFGHESVLHDRNFILRPTQYFPPFLGLVKFITF